MLSPSFWFISAQAVTMDEVDMLVREENWLGQIMLRKKRKWWGLTQTEMGPQVYNWQYYLKNSLLRILQSIKA